MLEQEEFERFQGSFNRLSSALSRKISSIAQLRGQEKNEVIRDADIDIEEMSSIIRRMDTSMRSYPYHLKAKLEPVHRRLKNSFDEQKQDLSRAKLVRPARFGNSNDQPKTLHEEQRQRLLDKRETGADVSSTLDGIRVTTIETENIGIGVTSRLREQRDQMIRSRDVLDETDEYVNRARRTMSRMARRVMTDKCIQGLIVFLEIGIICVIIYERWLKSK